MAFEKYLLPSLDNVEYVQECSKSFRCIPVHSVSFRGSLNHDDIILIMIPVFCLANPKRNLKRLTSGLPGACLPVSGDQLQIITVEIFHFNLF